MAGEFALPGGLLWENEEVIGFHLPPIDENPEPYIGHCMVVTRRHVDHFADLTEQEATSVAQASRALAGALRAEGVERVHIAVIGLGGDHFHQHLIPRYPGVPPGTSWMAVSELPDAPHGGATEIAEFADRLHGHLKRDDTRLGQCAGWCLRVRLRFRVEVVRSGAETLGALAGVRLADPAPIRGGPPGACRGAVGAAQGPLYFT